MQRNRFLELSLNLRCALMWARRKNISRVGYHLFHAGLALI